MSGAAALKEYTLEEVALHNKKGDAWVVVDGYVYDVSIFSRLHPGGESILMKHAGKDASKDYKVFHNESVLRKYHDKLVVGKVANFEVVEEMILFADPFWLQRFQSPYYTESHRQFQRDVRSFVNEHIVPFVDQYGEKDVPPQQLVEMMGKKGYLAILCGSPYPVAYADPSVVFPENLDPFHELILVDEIARIGHPPLISAITNGPSIALSAVLRFGSDEQKKNCVPAVLSGKKYIALAISEPGAGSDVAGLTCEAKRVEGDPNKLVLNFNKKWITNATYADFFVVAARTGGAGHAGLSLLLLDKNTTPNFSVRKIAVRGGQVSGTGYLDFNNSIVPTSCILGREGEGFKMTVYNFQHERIYLSTICNRLARICLEESIRYASRRHVFGKPLSHLQSIRLKVAAMARRIELMHNFIETVTYQVKTMPKEEADLKLGDVTCLLKAESSKVFEFCARETTQIFGGNSIYMDGVGKRIEPMVMAVKSFQVPAGAEDVMEDFAGRMIFKVSKL